MMKYKATKLLALIAFVSLAATSCKEDVSTIDTDNSEQEIFNGWMAQYHPELLSAYQETQDGQGYYIDIATVGDTSGRALADTACWIEYELTGCDLYGNVSITRSDVVAWQQGTFEYETHYVPYFRFKYSHLDYEDEDKYSSLLECTEAAFSSYLTLDSGETYDTLLYNGASFTIYSPSTLASTGGTTGTGGYDGQFELSTMPFVCKIRVTNVVYNPITNDENLVNGFAIANGGLTINPEALGNGEDSSDDSDSDKGTVVVDPALWTNATSNIPFVYLNNRYTLNFDGKTSFNYTNTYTSTVPKSPYSKGMAALDKQINEALELRFSGDYDRDGGLVGDDKTASVWYICRTLDGFIVDTNIAEVKDIIYATTASTGSAISYNAESDEKSYIAAWFYSIPMMRYGSWNAIVTASSYAYGSSGSGGTTTTSSSSSSSSYYDYYNSYNNYYGGYGGYGGYGYGGYGGYGSYYGNSYYDPSYYNYGGSSSSTTTTTTVSTEILPYSPLLFQIYVVASDEDDDDSEE